MRTFEWMCPAKSSPLARVCRRGGLVSFSAQGTPLYSVALTAGCRASPESLAALVRSRPSGDSSSSPPGQPCVQGGEISIMGCCFGFCGGWVGLSRTAHQHDHASLSCPLGAKCPVAGKSRDQALITDRPDGQLAPYRPAVGSGDPPRLPSPTQLVHLEHSPRGDVQGH